MPELLRHFDVDEAKLQVLAACIDDYGIAEDEGVSESAEWPNNMISRHAVVYGNGAIARRGEPLSFATNPDELALCERLAHEAKAVVGEMPVGMGSEGGDPFYPFFIAADEAVTRPANIDDALIRARFGGTLFPLAEISVESLQEQGVWWSEVEAYGAEEEEAEGSSKYLEPWRALIAWFNGRDEFVETAFVRIGDDVALWKSDKNAWPPETVMTPCTLPRLALGMTRGGSLCGLFGWAVKT